MQVKVMKMRCGLLRSTVKGYMYHLLEFMFLYFVYLFGCRMCVCMCVFVCVGILFYFAISLLWKIHDKVNLVCECLYLALCWKLSIDFCCAEQYQQKKGERSARHAISEPLEHFICE